MGLTLPPTILRFFRSKGEKADADAPGWLLAIPLLGAVLGYARALHGEFVFDDISSVVQDPAAQSLAATTRALLPSLLSVEHSPAVRMIADDHLGSHRSAGLEGGRVFTAWTFALNHGLGGLDPFGYHLVNLGLHLGVAILVFVFVRDLLRRAVATNPSGCALAVAGAFALHPLHSQAVSYVTQRSEVLASAAYLGSLLLMLRASTARRLSASLLLVLALAIFTIGLGTKVIVVTMPAAYLLLVLSVPDGRPSAVRPGWARHLILTTPFFFLAAWKAHALFESVKGHTDAGFSLTVPGLNPWTYFITQWRVVLVYARLIFWPSGQNLDWLYPVSTRLDLGVVALLTLGEIRYSIGDPGGAAGYLAEAVKVEPNEPVRLLLLGRALAQLDQPEGACRAWFAAARSPLASGEDQRNATGLAAGLGCGAP